MRSTSIEVYFPKFVLEFIISHVHAFTDKSGNQNFQLALHQFEQDRKGKAQEEIKPWIANLGNFPGDSVGKEPACNAGDTGDTSSVPGLRRSLGEGHGNPLQYYCLENPMDREAWWATVHRSQESDTTEATKHSRVQQTCHLLQ